MSGLKVKICGITRAQDALAAAEQGAWAVGFILCPGTPRSVTPAQAREMGAALPRTVLRVGVFLDQTPEQIRRADQEARLDLIQLHGRETAEQCRAVGAGRCIKAWVLQHEGGLDRQERAAL